MSHIIIGAFTNPQDAAAAQGELQEAGARNEDFSVIDQSIVEQVGDGIVDVLLAVGLPQEAITPYATTVDAGGVALSVKDNTLSDQEVAPCFQRHHARMVNLVSTREKEDARL